MADLHGAGWFLTGVESAYTWEHVLEGLQVQERERYTRTAVLGVAAAGGDNSRRNAASGRLFFPDIAKPPAPFKADHRHVLGLPQESSNCAAKRWSIPEVLGTVPPQPSVAGE